MDLSHVGERNKSYGIFDYLMTDASFSVLKSNNSFSIGRK